MCDQTVPLQDEICCLSGELSELRYRFDDPVLDLAEVREAQAAAGEAFAALVPGLIAHFEALSVRLQLDADEVGASLGVVLAGRRGR